MEKAIGKNENGETVEFEVINGTVFCYRKNLTELTLPEEVKIVDCSSNKLTELILPKGIERVDCSYNNLTELKLPKGVIVVSCSYNKLTDLKLPEGVRGVYCENNNIINDENTFTNPQTGRVVFKQNGLFYAGCFCGKTEYEMKEKCLKIGFYEIIKHFKLIKKLNEKILFNIKLFFDLI